MPAGSRPHDVAPARDGGVWYTAQGSGELGWLNPRTGRVREVPLGPGSAPHGVIVGPDGAPWITDGGLNAIVRVEPRTGRFVGSPSRRRVRREPQHRDVRPARCPLVHGSARTDRPARPEGRSCARLLRAARGRPVWDHDHSAWSGLFRVARRELRRPDRPAQRSDHGSPAAEARAGRSPGLVRLSRQDLDQRVERGQAGCLRPGPAPLGRVAAARLEPAAVRGLCRQPRHRLAQRLRRERNCPVRSAHTPVHADQLPPSSSANVGSSSAARASSGAPSRVWTSSWSCGRAESA